MRHEAISQFHRQKKKLFAAHTAVDAMRCVVLNGNFATLKRSRV